MALFLSLGKSERLKLLPPRGWNKSVKLMIYQRMSVYVDVGSKVSWESYEFLNIIWLLSEIKKKKKKPRQMCFLYDNQMGVFLSSDNLLLQRWYMLEVVQVGGSTGWRRYGVDLSLEQELQHHLGTYSKCTFSGFTPTCWTRNSGGSAQKSILASLSGDSDSG